ncbi:MAG: hypothetical protein AAF940_15455 [Pseudomonadota bacterium]
MASLIRGLARIALLVLLILGGQKFITSVSQWLDMALMPESEDMLRRAIILGTVVYIVLLAIPFVPGAEIGLVLLTAFGAKVALLVYLATIFSMMLAYMMGRLLPPRILQSALGSLGLKRAAALVERAADMKYEDIREHLIPPTAPTYLRALLRFRYVALALAINTPGNVVLGGGGGIALMAGLSRIFSPLPFLLSTTLAVVPVPLLFFLGQR